ncbi:MULTISPECIES: UDP-N-acetylmuramoyl-L-alanine--D-glutamate ligase [unclassified Coleofasciculus]|uniref:UDP-N-acetylmuramoyl-L-alanine--D-glutamate ligase n=1 Tax=unclassified Coleofasciculus TaxID=2692782 RepID=UPI00188258A7|nr:MULTISPECIES: UDP-N-acetylmuramoyl-L-alanine--D-glutamate ligase [unclassified Coleofasciculus]MBE9125230.1 UDP-N-acetylmuramoyl-L-alanine--D-glutamate ligase [Coleofasciculus sp. LEGE 07081]MBE9148417.1 UDP-N-acetylmuramoyl-L-alanine--D-glutamate ligase [Coleofasciculus sp. LEGE 07092]
MPNAHVIGLGRSGIAAARLLKQEGWQVIVSDSKTSEFLQLQQQELSKEGIPVKLSHSLMLEHSDLPQLIVVSPGVPWDIPILIEARNRGIDTVGELELAWRHLNGCPWVGITGTNGKTTTTALIAAIFQTAGFQAPACGNIGYAACELALKERERGSRGKTDNSSAAKRQKSLDWIIAEISSYQIESSRSLAPRIGVWTTFTPDHLNRHQTLDNYYNIKASLLARSQLQVFNGDDSYLRQLGANHWADAYWTSVKGQTIDANFRPWVYIENGWVIAEAEPILPVASLRMVGNHNHQNLLMAVAAARLVGIEKEAIAHGIVNFPGVPHRLEHIITWQGIDFINDSKATNYDAAQVGLAAVAAPTILIAGGEAKTGDDSQWMETIKGKAAAVLLIGDAAPAFAERLKQVGYTCYEIVETLALAVPRATELAQQYQARVVLLSPACASFDQYQSFEHRGDDFRQLCLELLRS